MGIHSASDTEKDWPWYTKLVGHVFKIHPEIQSAQLNVETREFPGLEYFPNSVLWTDEWYEFGPATVNDLTYLLTVEEITLARAWAHFILLPGITSMLVDVRFTPPWGTNPLTISIMLFYSTYMVGYIGLRPVKG